MPPTFRVEHADCLDFMRTIPDGSIDLICTDPPYFKVKQDAWDHQWVKPADFLRWLGAVADEWKRILKPNGALYCFASTKMSARVELELAERFYILNRITWDKRKAGCHLRTDKDTLQCFCAASEAILFAEHVTRENTTLEDSAANAFLPFLQEPVRAYLDSERRLAGYTSEEVIEAIGSIGRHWFTPSQWGLPTREKYEQLRDLFNSKGGSFLTRPYDELQKECENLRRFFQVTSDIPYTDVWDWPTVVSHKGKHPCEKPGTLLSHIICTSSREGDTVFDCFTGGGSTGVAAVKNGRSFLGCDASDHWVSYARERLDAILNPTYTWFDAMEDS